MYSFDAQDSQDNSTTGRKNHRHRKGCVLHISNLLRSFFGRPRCKINLKFGDFIYPKIGEEVLRGDGYLYVKLQVEPLLAST